MVRFASARECAGAGSSWRLDPEEGGHGGDLEQEVDREVAHPKRDHVQYQLSGRSKREVGVSQGRLVNRERSDVQLSGPRCTRSCPTSPHSWSTP